jgi:hypothetical protein
MMTLLVKTFIGLSLVALIVILVSAQEQVNFSGAWVMDESQSDLSPLLGLGNEPDKVWNASMTMVVEQQGSNLRVTRSLKIQGKERKEIHTYKIGDGETTNTGAGGEAVVSRAFWEGDKLAIASTVTRRGPMKDILAEIRDVWSLSPDAKTLIISFLVDGPRGTQRGKLVFDKQQH